MADEPISALTLFTSYSTADEVEILDVSDTTFASTGTNKRIPFSTLLTMAGVGTAAGVATVAGGGTGLTAVGSADQLLGVAAHRRGPRVQDAHRWTERHYHSGGRLDHDRQHGQWRWNVEPNDDGRGHDPRRRKRHAGAVGDRIGGSGLHGDIGRSGMGGDCHGHEFKPGIAEQW